MAIALAETQTLPGRRRIFVSCARSAALIVGS